MGKPAQMGLFDAPARRPAVEPPGGREGWSSQLAWRRCSICNSWRIGTRVHTSLTNDTAHPECSEKVIEVLRAMLASGRIKDWPCTVEALRAISEGR